MSHVVRQLKQLLLIVLSVFTLTLSGCLGKGLDMPESGYGDWRPREKPDLPQVPGLSYYWAAESLIGIAQDGNSLISVPTQWTPLIGDPNNYFINGGGPNYPYFYLNEPWENDWRDWALPTVSFSNLVSSSVNSALTGLGSLTSLHIYVVAQRWRSSGSLPEGVLFELWGAGGGSYWPAAEVTYAPGSSGGVYFGLDLYDSAGSLIPRAWANVNSGNSTALTVGVAGGVSEYWPTLYEISYDFTNVTGAGDCYLRFNVDSLDSSYSSISNGLDVGTGCNVAAMSGLRIGNNMSNRGADYHEILIYNHALSESERSELYHYFHDKYDPTYYYY